MNTGAALPSQCVPNQQFVYTCAFTDNGSLTLPAGAADLNVTVFGGAGSKHGGKGAEITLSQGQAFGQTYTFSITGGGGPGASSFQEQGGVGGAAAAISGPTSPGGASVLLAIAGGGGGGGGGGGTTGGNAGLPGQTVSGDTQAGGFGQPGGAASGTTGGALGQGGAHTTTNPLPNGTCDSPGEVAGHDGGAGASYTAGTTGSNGGNGGNAAFNNSVWHSYSGGGGGGGYAGGGGGGSSEACTVNGYRVLAALYSGAGGGGSSYLNPTPGFASTQLLDQDNAPNSYAAAVNVSFRLLPDGCLPADASGLVLCGFQTAGTYPLSIPSTATNLQITAAGGQGGVGGGASTNQGGLGAQVSGSFGSAYDGQTLSLTVAGVGQPGGSIVSVPTAGQGGFPDGANGGALSTNLISGGGGGGSRVGVQGVSAPLIVAGGGGGAGQQSTTSSAGGGGSAGAAGAAGAASTAAYGTANGGGGGGAATGSAAGSGGFAGTFGGGCASGSLVGSAGTTGGAGGSGSAGRGGGGGGGGLFVGGGGGEGGRCSSGGPGSVLGGGGGGGGGSSFIDPSATSPSTATSDGGGWVAVSYTTKLDQTITFASIPDHIYGDSAFNVNPTASSGLPVTVSSATTGVCTVASASPNPGWTVTIVGGGTCTLNANQAGNGTYNAALQVSQSFTVNPASQSITFNPIANQKVTVAPFTVSPTATSGLTVAVASNTTSVCTVSGTTVTLVGAGSCSLTAGQPGDADYSAATPVTQTFDVSTPNIVKDGSFESPIEPNGNTLRSAGQKAGPWNVTNGSIEIADTYWQNASGNQSIDLAGLAPGTITQTITLQWSGTYTVKFKYAGNPEGLPVKKHLTLTANAPSWGSSVSVSKVFDTSSTNTTFMGWKSGKLAFTGTAGDVVTLTFQDTDTATAYGATLDAVSMSAR